MMRSKPRETKGSIAVGDAEPSSRGWVPGPELRPSAGHVRPSRPHESPDGASVLVSSSGGRAEVRIGDAPRHAAWPREGRPPTLLSAALEPAALPVL